jgi:hypothetical protein
VSRLIFVEGLLALAPRSEQRRLYVLIQERGLSGLDGLLAYWRAHADLCGAIVDRLDVPKLVLDVDTDDWSERVAESAISSTSRSRARRSRKQPSWLLRLRPRVVARAVELRRRRDGARTRIPLQRAAAGMGRPVRRLRAHRVTAGD